MPRHPTRTPKRAPQSRNQITKPSPPATCVPVPRRRPPLPCPTSVPGRVSVLVRLLRDKTPCSLGTTTFRLGQGEGATHGDTRKAAPSRPRRPRPQSGSRTPLGLTRRGPHGVPPFSTSLRRPCHNTPRTPLGPRTLCRVFHPRARAKMPKLLVLCATTRPRAL